MRIMEVKKVIADGVVWYEPIRGFTLWKHCSGGKQVVNDYEFENIVKPLLLQHDVREVNVVS